MRGDRAGRNARNLRGSGVFETTLFGNLLEVRGQLRGRILHARDEDLEVGVVELGRHL